MRKKIPATNEFHDIPPPISGVEMRFGSTSDRGGVFNSSNIFSPPIGIHHSSLSGSNNIHSSSAIHTPIHSTHIPFNFSSSHFVAHPHYTTVTTGQPLSSAQPTCQVTTPFSTVQNIAPPFNSQQVLIPFSSYMLPQPKGPFPIPQFIPIPTSMPNSGYQTHHTTNPPMFNPHPKIEFPKFNGIDPKGWVLKAK